MGSHRCSTGNKARRRRRDSLLCTRGMEPAAIPRPLRQHCHKLFYFVTTSLSRTSKVAISLFSYGAPINGSPALSVRHPSQRHPWRHCRKTRSCPNYSSPRPQSHCPPPPERFRPCQFAARKWSCHFRRNTRGRSVFFSCIISGMTFTPFFGIIMAQLCARNNPYSPKSLNQDHFAGRWPSGVRTIS